jgi:hypothetical protein
VRIPGHVNRDSGHVNRDSGHVNRDSGHVNRDSGHVNNPNRDERGGLEPELILTFLDQAF